MTLAADARAGSAPALRPLTVTEILDGAVRAVWAQRRAVFPIAVPIVVVMAALSALIQYAAIRSSGGSSILSGIGVLLVPVLLGTVITGLVAPALAGTLLGDRMGSRASLRAVGSAALGLLPLCLVLTVAEGAGLVLFVVGGVWLWGIWAVAAPALAVERLGPFRALGRSASLVSGGFWRTWGVRALGWVVAYVIGQVSGLLFQAIALWVTDAHPLHTSGHLTDQPGLYVSITSIGTLLGLLVTAPFAAAVDTYLYLDLRMRREGMDIVLALPPLPAVPPQPGPGSRQW